MNGIEAIFGEMGGPVKKDWPPLTSREKELVEDLAKLMDKPIPSGAEIGTPEFGTKLDVVVATLVNEKYLESHEDSRRFTKIEG